MTVLSQGVLKLDIGVNGDISARANTTCVSAWTWSHWCEGRYRFVSGWQQ